MARVPLLVVRSHGAGDVGRTSLVPGLTIDTSAHGARLRLRLGLKIFG